MITEFIVKVNGENVYLDTLDELPISLNYNIADINKIESKNSSYSKTITLPDSKVNRDAFRHIFQLNSDSTFDITKKSRCWILKDTVVQFEGNLQLTNITYDNNFNMNGYEVVIYSDNDTLYKNIGEKYLTDLSLSSYDHKFTYQNVIYSFTQSYDNGYYYPLIDYAGNLTRNFLKDGAYMLGSTLSNIYPATYVKAIVDQIFFEAGYGYTSDFFNSPEYKRLIIPFNNKSFLPVIYNVTTDSNDTLFIVRSTGSMSTVQNQYIGSNETTEWASFSRDLEIYDPNNFYEGVPSTYYFRNTSTTLFSLKFRIDLDITITASYPNTNAPWAPAATNPNDDIFLLVKRQFTPGTTTPVASWFNAAPYSAIFPYNSGGYPEITFGGSSYYSVKSALSNNDLSMTYSTSGGNNIWRIQGTIYTDEVSSSNPLKQNEEVRFFFVRNKTNENYATNTTVVGSQSTISGILNRNLAVIGADIRLQDNLPANVKQKDFLTSISKMFNLYMEPEKDKSNSFIIEPRDDYYRKYQVVKDWSRKLDVSKSITSIFTTNQQSRSNLFTYKEDKDFYNTDYKNNTKKIFGEYTYDIDNDFIKGENKIELIFSPTINDLVPNTTSIYVPEIISYNNSVKTSAGGVNPRILYSKPIGLTSGSGSIIADVFKVGTYSVSVYPYAGNVNDPLSPTYSINFGSVNSYYRDYIETPENLFVNYYQNQMIDISDKNSRIVTAYFNLTSNDISQFRFSDLIIFRVNGTDGYYRVNKIIDYDPTVNMTTKVELIRAINYNIPKRITPTSVIGTVIIGSASSDINVISSLMAPLGNGGGNGSGALSFVSLDGGSGNSSGGNANLFLGDNNSSQGSNNIILGNSNQVYGSSNLVIGDGMEITSNKSININDGTNPQLLLSSTGRNLESSTSSYYIFENGTASTMLGTFSYSETITPTYTLTDRGGVITYTSPRDYNGIIVYDPFLSGTNSIVSNIRFEIDSQGMYGTISTISSGAGLKNYTLKFDINRYLVSSATSNDVISISILPLLRNVLNISGVYNDVLFYYTWFKLKLTNYHYIIGPGNSGYYEYNSLHYLVNGGGGANYLSSLTYSNNSGNNILLYPSISTTGDYFVHENIYATYSSFTMNTTYELSGTIAYD